MAIYRALGRAIAARRSTLKLTQADLAERAGTSRASIANIEAGRQKVLLHQVYRFVEALELRSIVDILPDRHAGDVASDAADLPVWGADVSDAQRVGLDRLLLSALAVEPRGAVR